MIGGSTFLTIFGSVPAGDDRVTAIARAAAAAGMAIVINRPGSKQPMCTLTARQAKQVGRHPCGIDHATTDPAVLKRVLDRTPGANIGVELGASRMLVVDVDTPQERDAFLADWTAASGQAQDHQTLTVQSPGSRDAEGRWVHHGGGHWWFTLPDGLVLPTGQGVLKAPGGWVAMWHQHQVLVPPSVRAEGPYRLVGDVQMAPAWLTDMIIKAVESWEYRRDTLPDPEGDIEQWSAGMPWTTLLGPDGWVDTGLVDTCSCPVWTAPGIHASAKSATAHQAGCDRFDTSTGWGPLHIWTDHPPSFLTGISTVTKLNYLALREHQGNYRATLQDLGMLEADPEFPPLTSEEDDLPFDVPGSPEIAGGSERSSLWDLALASEDLDSIPEPEPLIEGVLHRDTLARMVGRSGHGKSFVAIDMMACIATGQDWHGHPVHQGLVIYLVAEGARGFRRRLRAWEDRHHGGVPIPRDHLLILPVPVQVTGKQWPDFRTGLRERRPVLVVLDTQARITVGVKENDNTEMGVFVERLEGIRRDTGACVLPIHHLGHLGEHGRGASTVTAALDSELRVSRADDGSIVLTCDKSKDVEPFDDLIFRLDPVADSVVVTALDPFQAPQPPDRIRELLAAVGHASHRGLTKSEVRSIMTSVPQSSFYRLWDKAIHDGHIVSVDRSQRYRVPDHTE